MNLKGKKRYIAAGLVVIFMLYKCSGDDDRYAYTQQQGYAAQSQQDPQDYAQQPGYAPQVAQPVAGAGGPAPVIIVNTPAPGYSDGGGHGFLNGFLMGHLFGNMHSHSYHSEPVYSRSTHNVTNVRNVTNVKNVRNVSSTNKKTVTPSPKGTSWAQPSTTARSYTVTSKPQQQPKPASSWSAAPKKSSGYTYKSTKYSYKSGGFKTRSFSRRRR